MTQCRLSSIIKGSKTRIHIQLLFTLGSYFYVHFKTFKVPIYLFLLQENNAPFICCEVPETFCGIRILRYLQDRLRYLVEMLNLHAHGPLALHYVFLICFFEFLTPTTCTAY